MHKYKSNISQFGLKKIKSDYVKAKISGSRDAADYVRQFYYDDISVQESFFLLLLNNSNNTIGYVKISQGGITGTVVDVRIVAKYAIDSLATSVILAHNHPSGNLKPSEADKQLTKKVVEGLRLLDVKVLDHIILVPEDNGYFSFADESLM